MQRSFHHRLVRGLAACLLLAQVNLLWIAEWHHHEPPVPLARGAAKVFAGSSGQQPSRENALLCPVCQIVRQSAARPSTGSPAPESAASAPLQFVVSLESFHSHRPIAAFGRAPPLS
ncbi:MAG TPA: hypothetical protein VGW33_04875 [Terriglobia bacterium]|nr:hypothetical protein [Terriglobia bacterium]